MPPLANYHLDKVALTNPEHGWLLTADTQLDLPAEQDLSEVTLPGAHGVVGGIPAQFGAPVLELTHDIAAESQAELRARYQGLTSLLRSASTLRRTEAGAAPVEAGVELASISTPSRFVAGRSLAFTSQFRLPGVFWRDPGWSTVQTWEFAELLDDIEVTAARGSSAPIVDAQIRIRGPISSVVIVDNESKTSVRWGGSLPEGSALYLHPAHYVARIRHNLTYDWSLDAGTDASGGLDWTQTGMLRLTPAMTGGDPMDRRVTIDANGSGRAGGQNGTQLAIRAKGAYL